MRRLNVVSPGGRLTNAGVIAFVGRGDPGLDYVRRAQAGGDSLSRLRRPDRSLIEELIEVFQAVDANTPTIHVQRGLVIGMNEFSGYVGVAIAGVVTGYAASLLELHRLQTRPLVDPAIIRRFHIYTRSDRPLGPAARCFTDHLIAHAHERGWGAVPESGPVTTPKRSRRR